LKAISFLNSNIGYCSGTNNDGIIMKTTNGGLNWLSSTVDFSAWGSGNIVIIDQNVIFINSWSRTLKSTNSGLNWFNVSHPGFGIHNLYFFDVNTGFAVGYDFSIYKTTNSGINWTNKYRNTNSAYLNSIHFFNNMTGFAGGDKGRLLKTVNSGENWYEVYSPSSNDVYTVQMQDTNIINIGGNQFIYKTTEGVIPIKILTNNTILPGEFSLSQNYPNPFNPQTKIKFAVPSNVKGQTSNVKLVIYDLLGREVVTLVNEELKPGTYEADWDASNYSSGVYFYKIISNDFVETKKMVLMK
ncbi:MAG TPA: T9SS type A sorting domain-containing protein, partial [Ignavibacteria bacterium]|nr:T9SS type A sorting domain-containing protein [Ignavibacteria bacterium]